MRVELIMIGKTLVLSIRQATELSKFYPIIVTIVPPIEGPLEGVIPPRVE
jgi:hypothetical protein